MALKNSNITFFSSRVFIGFKNIFHLPAYISLEKAMAPHSSTLALKIPWMVEPGGLQSMGLLRVGHDWATSLSCIGEGNGNPLQCSCLENPRDGRAWWAAVYGVTESRTRLKRLRSSSSLHFLFLKFIISIDIFFPHLNGYINCFIVHV